MQDQTTLNGAALTEMGDSVSDDGVTPHASAGMQADAQGKANNQGTSESAFPSQGLEKDATVLGLYHVESDALEGGMGRVFRVLHTGWNIELAVKQPHARFFRTDEQKEAFIGECDAWINLGLHPHIVSCYYVRQIEGIPSIFSEWMEGGSLADWIRTGRLYEGSREEQCDRILDIAIQFARGLHYAHDNGLIHQDVKPDNLLLTEEGDAKVADFGIARAREALTPDTSEFPVNATMVSASGAYTPAYCSPEQQNGGHLTRRTDIYSWAVSVLEMFIGERLWQSGVIAGAGCEDYFHMDARVPVPSGMKDLLRECFADDPAGRPHDFATIDTALQQVYQDETGLPYPKEMAQAAAETADSLNNRALTFLDLGKYDEAEDCWERALSIAANHGDSLYNKCAYLMMNNRLDDSEAIKLLSENPTGKTDYYLALLHLAQGDSPNAAKRLRNARTVMGDTEEIDRLLSLAEADAGDACLMSIDGRPEGITFTCFSPDQQSVLVGYRDGELHLWDRATSECMRSFEGHSGYIKSACFSDDGTLMVSGSSDETARLWDVSSGDCLHVLEGHAESVLCVLFSPDGKMILSTGEDKDIRLWDLEGTLLRSFRAGKGFVERQGFTKGVGAAAFIDQGRTIVTFEKETAAIETWDAETGKRLRAASAACEGVAYTVALNHQGTMALGTDIGGRIDCFDTSTGQILKTLRGHSMSVNSLCFSPDDEVVAAGDWDGGLKLWHIGSGKSIFTYDGHEGDIGSINYSPDGMLLVSGSQKQMNAKPEISFKVWRVPEKPRYEWVISKISETESTAKYQKDAERYSMRFKELLKEEDITGALSELEKLSRVPVLGKSALYYELKQMVQPYCVLGKVAGFQTQTVARGSEMVSNRMTSMSPDGRLVVFQTGDCVLSVWSTIEKRKVAELDNSPNRLDTKNLTSSAIIRFSPDSSKLACLSEGEAKVLLWDMHTMTLLHTFAGSGQESGISRWVQAMEFNADGSEFFLCDSKCVDFWDTSCGEHIQTVRIPHLQVVRAIEPDKGIALAEVREDNSYSVQAWDLKTGELIRTFDNTSTTYVCFSPDGTHIFTDIHSRFLRYYEVDSGICAYEISTPTHPHSICFTEDGTQALVNIGGHDHEFYAIEASTGRKTVTFKGHADRVLSNVRYSPDGTKVLSGSYDTTMKLWDAHTGECLHTFTSTAHVDDVAFSSDGSKVLSASNNEVMVHYLDYELDFPGWQDWDKGALPYARLFLQRHPDYSESDFQGFITELQQRGYGWLRPEGVRKMLGKQKRSQSGKGLFGIFRGR